MAQNMWKKNHKKNKYLNKNFIYFFFLMIFISHILGYLKCVECPPLHCSFWSFLKDCIKVLFLMVNWNIFSHTYTVIHQCHIVFSSRKQVSSVYFIFTEYMIHLFLYLFSCTQIYQSFFQIEKKAPSVSFIFTAYVIHLFPYLYSYTQFNFFVM